MRLLHAFSLLPFFALATDPVRDLAPEKLEFEQGHGFLSSVLRELDIDPSSQVLVFSKSSLQPQVSPKNPRAIYFNEDTYIAWIPTAPLIEVMTVDPKLGPQFYSIPNQMQPAKIDREGERCFRCHGRSSVQLFALSSHVAPSGYPRIDTPTVRVSPDTPFEDRWGGWYVTGTHGKMRHMGNALSTFASEGPKLIREVGANRTDLSAYFDTKKYLTPHSDIVALMVMEQQMEVQNAITNLLKAPSEEAISRLVDVMLSVGEVPLEAPISGTSGFAAAYAERFPKDLKGRSLGELDLETRLQKYPCSPLVYSKSFQSLPQRDEVLRQLKSKSTREVQEILTSTL